MTHSAAKKKKKKKKGTLLVNHWKLEVTFKYLYFQYFKYLSSSPPLAFSDFQTVFSICLLFIPL